MPDYYMYICTYIIKIHAFACVRCCACACVSGVFMRVRAKL